MLLCEDYGVQLHLPCYPVTDVTDVGSWTTGFSRMSTKQTNKNLQMQVTGHLQNPRKFADGMNPAYWQLQSSISMDQSIILATIATIAGIITRRCI